MSYGKNKSLYSDRHDTGKIKTSKRRKKSETVCPEPIVLEKHLTRRESAKQSYFSSPEQKSPANITDSDLKGCFLKETEKVCTVVVHLKIVTYK